MVWLNEKSESAENNTAGILFVHGEIKTVLVQKL